MSYEVDELDKIIQEQNRMLNSKIFYLRQKKSQAAALDVELRSLEEDIDKQEKFIHGLEKNRQKAEDKAIAEGLADQKKRERYGRSRERS